ncbi:inositol monophosphatase family protein [Arthrobacter sp. B3I4]|uniref:inositol monophosphatase family protein n=1 Tax=Arthrobacter sp. B3I4 TaxID=3042267 RepID=UPI00278B3FBA|nr:inositol monophosphatase family protein [Arthrobacter sp. B3I4]MDQ0757359.1 myo-inositol-1(or 4)-monophosphatase [Arthrobacter sp. B3I4]
MTEGGRSQKHQGPCACAHRGDTSRHRENTIAAVTSALAAGADFVEIDVRVTADGTVIVLHDPTLERLWGVDRAVSEMTREEIGSAGDGTQRIPLLAEVLPLFAASESTLLIDMDSAEPAAAAYEVASGSGVNVAWCGDLDGMRLIRSVDADARVWMPWDKPQPPTAADTAALAPEFINSDVRFVTPGLVRAVHALGYKVAVWTVDDEPGMLRMLDAGVDSVTTNRLPDLQRLLRGRPRRQPGYGSRTDAGPAGLDLDRAAAVARQLGEWAIKFISSTDPGQISTKEDPADLVTEVDVGVERHVREIIGAQFSGHSFVGEELGGSSVPGVPCWYLDPVDGTANLANGIPWNAFSLSLALDGVPLVGVVADPWRNEIFEAVQDRGAKLNGAPLRIPFQAVDGDPLSGRIVSTELANHRTWPGMLEMLAALSERHCTLRVMGSGTMSVVGIAAGRGAGAVIHHFGPADHLAAALIVQEAGGTVLDAEGRRCCFPASGGVLAAAPHAADALYGLWRSSLSAAGEMEATARPAAADRPYRSRS